MHKHTGEEYFDSEEFRELLETYENAVDTGQPIFLDADELADIAEYYQVVGQPDSADVAIQHALDLDPHAIGPMVYKIHEALYNGDIDEAEQLLSQFVDKSDPDYVYVQGEILLAKGKPDEADAYFREQFKTIEPDEYQDYIIDVASIFEDFNYAEHAMGWVKRAKHEDSSEYKELMARTLFGLGKYKDSERLFNELIDADPFSKRYWNALASAQFMNEDYTNAIQSCEYAIAIDPTDPESIIAKANGLYRLSNFEDALDYFKRYSELVPDDEFALMHQGTCYVNLNLNDEAIAVLNRALEVAPSDSPYLADIYQEMAFAYSEKGDYDEALAWLDKTDAMDCDHVQVLVVKGHVHLAAGHMAESERCFQEAVVNSDDANQTLLRIIVSLYDNNFLDVSYSLFKKFFRIVPDDYTEGYAYMALCCYDLGKYKEFLDYLERACEVNPAECKLALSHMFPEEVEPQNYYQYIKDNLQK